MSGLLIYFIHLFFCIVYFIGFFEWPDVLLPFYSTDDCWPIIRGIYALAFLIIFTWTWWEMNEAERNV